MDVEWKFLQREGGLPREPEKEDGKQRGITKNFEERHLKEIGCLFDKKSDQGLCFKKEDGWDFASRSCV